jgi:hypothetical protein
MARKRVSLQAKARGGSTGSEKSINACCFGYIVRPISYKGAPQGLISAEYANTTQLAETEMVSLS